MITIDEINEHNRNDLLEVLSVSVDIPKEELSERFVNDVFNLDTIIPLEGYYNNFHSEISIITIMDAILRVLLTDDEIEEYKNIFLSNSDNINENAQSISKLVKYKYDKEYGSDE